MADGASANIHTARGITREVFGDVRCPEEEVVVEVVEVGLCTLEG